MKKRYFLLLCGCVVSTAAHADTGEISSGLSSDASSNISSDMFTPFVSTNFNYNSNLFALENTQAALSILGSTQTADYITMLTAGVNLNWILGQQTIIGHAIFNQSWYNTYKNLDNTGSDVLLQWNWVLGDRLSGQAGVSETTQLGNLTYIQAPINDVFTTRDAFLKGSVKLDDRWQVNLGVDNASYDNSIAILQAYNLTINAANIGLQYVTPRGSKVEWLSQYSQGTYPALQYNALVPVTNIFNQSDNGIKFDWIASAKTHVSGALNYTQHTSPNDPAQSYSGVTGRLEAFWFITGKTSLDLAVYRDYQPYDTAFTSFQLVEGSTLNFIWRSTSKITATLGLHHDNVNFPVDSGFTVLGASAMNIRSDTATAGINYQILRNTKFVLNAERGVRASDTAGFSYTYNSISVGLQQNF